MPDLSVKVFPASCADVAGERAGEAEKGAGEKPRGNREFTKEIAVFTLKKTRRQIPDGTRVGIVRCATEALGSATLSVILAAESILEY
jgi:hypothetical protein